MHDAEIMDNWRIAKKYEAYLKAIIERLIEIWIQGDSYLMRNC